MFLKGKQKLDVAKTVFKSMAPQRRVRFMPFALTPPEMRKKVPHPTENCISCLTHSEKWSEMFNTVCDKYEEVNSQLQEKEIQLHITKAALNRSQKAARVCNTQKERPHVGNGAQTERIDNAGEIAKQTKRIDKAVENGTQTERIDNADENAMHIKQTNTQSSDDSVQTFHKWAICLDHPYATTKPFSCKYCSSRFNRKFNRDKHIPTCKAKQTFVFNNSDDDEENSFEHDEQLYECRVCAKQDTYDKMRKHYLQYINSVEPRKNRYGHGDVSLSTHISYLKELKANKPKKKY